MSGFEVVGAVAAALQLGELCIKIALYLKDIHDRVDDPALQERFCGFLHDFDYSSLSRDVPQFDISTLSAEALEELLVTEDMFGDLKKGTVSLDCCVVS